MTKYYEGQKYRKYDIKPYSTINSDQAVHIRNMYMSR